MESLNQQTDRVRPHGAHQQGMQNIIQANSLAQIESECDFIDDMLEEGGIKDDHLQAGDMILIK